MSIFMGALSGVGEAGQRYAEANQKLWGEADLEKQRAELALQKGMALEQFKTDLSVNTADSMRTAQTARIDEAAKGLVAQAQAEKYAGAVPADPSTWTDEQQAAVDQSKQIDAAQRLRDSRTRDQAAILTGDISPEKAASMHNTADMTESKMTAMLERSKERSDSMAEVANIRAEAMNASTQAKYEVAIAKMQTAVEKAGKGNTDFDKKIALLKEAGSTPAEIAAYITERKQPSLEDLANGFLKADPQAGTKKAMTPDDAYAKAKSLRSLTKILDDDGNPKGAGPSSAPSAGKPSAATAASNPIGLPEGSVKIGTSGGKAVYQLPDGSKRIEN